MLLWASSPTRPAEIAGVPWVRGWLCLALNPSSCSCNNSCIDEAAEPSAGSAVFEHRLSVQEELFRGPIAVLGSRSVVAAGVQVLVAICMGHTRDTRQTHGPGAENSGRFCSHPG